MRVVTQQTFGGPDVLGITEAPPPEPLPTEVLVRVRAVGLNPVEAFIRAGAFPLLGEPPFVLGWDISGVVERATPQTWRLSEGDEVFGMPFFPRPAGGYAELVAAPARQLARKPPSLSHAEAAALALVGLTAWQGLIDLANVRAGDRVLIHAGGGGVGHVAIQLAKWRGAHVITTASAAKREFVTDLGADEVVDYQQQDFTEKLSDVDVVLDTVGGDYGERSVTVLRPGGLLVTAVDRMNTALAAKTEAAGRQFAGIAVDPDPIALQQLADLTEQSKLHVHVQQTFPLDQVIEAHRALDRGHIQGKLALTIGS